MKVIQTIFDEVKIVIPKVFGDHRGYFMESYHDRQLRDFGIVNKFIQDNHSLSIEKGTIRGLHYQLSPKSQSKLIRVVRGSIWDVVVDIRESSPHFGEWFAVELSEKNKKQLFIPKGFAHGFCTLEDNTEVIYKVDNNYSKDLDRGIAWNDQTLAIDWPTDFPVLSEKDQHHPSLLEAELDEDYRGGLAVE